MNSPILAPVVALVAWSMVMWTWMYATRLPAMFRMKMKSDPYAPRGEQMNQLPAEVRWKADNYNHLMEQPTIFYAIALSLALMSHGDGLNLTLAWVYVGLRVVHSLVQAPDQQDRSPLRALRAVLTGPGRAYRQCPAAPDGVMADHRSQDHEKRGRKAPFSTSAITSRLGRDNRKDQIWLVQQREEPDQIQRTACHLEIRRRQHILDAHLFGHQFHQHGGGQRQRRIGIARRRCLAEMQHSILYRYHVLLTRIPEVEIDDQLHVLGIRTIQRHLKHLHELLGVPSD
jgi:hypothetical protein